MYYIIYHCDQWQSYESFRRIGICEEDALDECLLEIQNKLNYNDDDMNDYIYYESVEMNCMEI